MALFIESDFFQEWDPIRKSRPIRKSISEVVNVSITPPLYMYVPIFYYDRGRLRTLGIWNRRVSLYRGDRIQPH